jgi:hypothetical protein
MQSKHVLISKKTKRISLERYLLSKVAFFPETVNERDLLALFLNHIDLQEKADREMDFCQKFGSDLESVSIILKGINLTHGVSLRSLTVMSEKVKVVLSHYIVPRRNFEDFKLRFHNSYHLIFREPQGVPTDTLPAKRWIGVGYRDKGSAKDKAIDASPSWQSVATVAAGLERETGDLVQNVREAKTGLEAFAILQSGFEAQEKLEYLRRDPLRAPKVAKVSQNETKKR